MLTCENRHAKETPVAKHLGKAERRQQILEAALLAFGQRGYHNTQVSDIVTLAQVARGTFYLYFEGKREIFDAIVTEISNRVRKEIRPIATENLQEIPRQIYENIERATHLLLQNPLYIKIFFSDAVGLDNEFDDRLKKFYQYVLGNIRKGLEQGRDLGLVRDCDIQILSLCLMGSLKEIYYQHVLGTDKLHPGKVVKEVFRTVLQAVAKPELIPQILEWAAQMEAKPHLKPVLRVLSPN